MIELLLCGKKSFLQLVFQNACYKDPGVGGFSGFSGGWFLYDPTPSDIYIPTPTYIFTPSLKVSLS